MVAWYIFERLMLSGSFQCFLTASNESCPIWPCLRQEISSGVQYWKISLSKKRATFRYAWLENKHVQKSRELKISTAYFRDTTVVWIHVIEVICNWSHQKNVEIRISELSCICNACSRTSFPAAKDCYILVHFSSAEQWPNPSDSLDPPSLVPSVMGIGNPLLTKGKRV